MKEGSEVLKFPSRGKIIQRRAGEAGGILDSADPESIEYQRAKVDLLRYMDYMEKKQKRRNRKIPT